MQDGKLQRKTQKDLVTETGVNYLFILFIYLFILYLELTCL